MNTNEYVKEKKEGFFSRMFNFIKRLFKPVEALPAPDVLTDEITDTENNNIDTISNETFINELKVEPKVENPELLELQEKFESNQIELTELSDEDLSNLNDLYQRQIDDLRLKLDGQSF